MVSYDKVLTAAVSNKRLIVSSWLQSLAVEDFNVRHRLVQVLKKSAQCLSLDVIKLFKPPIVPRKILHEIINSTDSEGMAILHHATQSCLSTQNKKYIYTVMEVLTHLYEHGADPTILCNQERTPKTIAEENDNKTAVALLEILELVHCKQIKYSPIPQYCDINVLHKTILHWAVNSERHQLVSHIMLMHRTDQYEVITNLLFETDPNSLESLQEAPMFTAAKIGNPNLLVALLSHSGIPLNVLCGQRQKHTIPRPDGSIWERYSTLLSLLISLPQNDSTIKALVDICKASGGAHSTSVDLSKTGTRFLPVEFFHLPNLYSVNLQHNSISELPFSRLSGNIWPHLLHELDVSHNSIQHVPIELFKLGCLKKLNISHNPLESLPKQWWKTIEGLEILNVSHTYLDSLYADDELTLQGLSSPASLPRQHSIVQGQYSFYAANNIRCRTKSSADPLLQHLYANHCRIDRFPCSLVLFFPNLEVLNLSHNQLQLCCAVNELPASLTDLDISNNNLMNLKDHKVFYRDARLAGLVSCMRHYDLSKLTVLKLANNVNLNTLYLSDDTFATGNVGSHIFFSKLRRLDLSNCGLQQAPRHLAALQQLTDLDLGQNRNLTIPRDICNMESLTNFNYEGVEDPIVNELNMFALTRDKQIYLRQERNVRYPSIKLLFVGSDHEEIELPNLQPVQDKSVSLLVVNEHSWCISTSSSDLTINFNVWNFIDGQINNKPFVASQCFLTDSALYVLSWRITNDEDYGIGRLRKWLLRIHDRTKHAAVMVVGCHSTSLNDRKRHRLTKEVNNYCNKNSAFFPHVVAVNFVTVPKLKEDTVKLCKSFFDVACELEMSLGSKYLNQKLVNIKISKTYFQMLGLISKKVVCIEKKKDEGPPILTWDDIVIMTGINNQSSNECLFKDEKELSVAMKYMTVNGTIMYFDYPGLSDCYFIDPHWLYQVFCQVCTCYMVSQNARIGSDDGKVSQSLIQKVFDDCHISTKYRKPLFKLLCRLEIAIPLDSDTFLIPSALKSDSHNKLYTSENCRFPRDKMSTSMAKQYSFGNIFPPAASTKSPYKSITLTFTGMCYRRLFLGHYIPENFWWKLIPRFISSASFFYDILLNNCVKGITVERMANAGDAVICNNHCKWLYWRNGITLTFGDHVLLCVNGLLLSNDGNDKRIPLSTTVNKIKPMKFFDGSEWAQQFFAESDGFEVNIPDYDVQSSIEESGKTHLSCKLSCQILSHVLEILNELSTELFKGHPENGIYSGSLFLQLIPCPYCYGDTSPIDAASISDEVLNDESVTDSLHFLFRHSIQPIDFVEDASTAEIDLCGYHIQVCILQAQRNGLLTCPNHGNVKLLYLTPDLMFEDITLRKVSARHVNHAEQVGKGAFGEVYKVKLASDPTQHVALKCFTNLIINGKSREHTLKDLSEMYADIRLEINKLSSVDHPNIVVFLGLCVISFSFLLEWAPKGNLSQVVKEYRLADVPVCPDAVAKTVQQVASALAYLHTKKNIVHFDIKPDNVLVFKYPQPGHHCFTREASSLLCESSYGEGRGVLLKLADLGVSAYVGPGGFHRSTTTPTYAAPEVIKYSGKEPLSEKVDIFALGLSLYEVMTRRKLPPEGAALDFNFDISAGRRPEFAPEDPNYPLPLKSCVQCCWSHDYSIRPTAKFIEETFKNVDYIKLKNSYSIKNKVTAAVVTANQGTTVREETIWITTIMKDGSCDLLSCAFVDKNPLTPVATKARKHLRHVYPKLYISKHFVKLRSCVKEMCHYGQHIWILYSSGYLAIYDMESDEIIQNIETQELFNSPVTLLVANHVTSLFAVAYANGLVACLWANSFQSRDRMPITYFRSWNTMAVSHQSFKLTAMESWTANGHCQLWCGYSIGVIQVVIPPVGKFSETEVLKVLQVNEYCPDLPYDTSITQLKCSSVRSPIMYALHDRDLMISCWNIGITPELCAIISPSMTSPASVILPINDFLYIGNEDGKVYKVDTHQIAKGEYSYEALPGGHRIGHKVDCLVALQGELNAQGFLSAAGVTTIPDKEDKQSSTYFVKRFDNVPCTVLMSIGVGYQESFTQQSDSNDNFFVIWALPFKPLN